MPMLQVSALHLKQRATTAVAGLWGGTHACGRAAGTGRAPALRKSVLRGSALRGSALRAPACPHPPEPPYGHMCAHACAARRVGVREMHPGEVDVPPRPPAGLFRVSFQLYFAPLPRLCGCMEGCEEVLAGGSSGHPLAAPTPASPLSMQATIHPFIYANINILSLHSDRSLNVIKPFRGGALHSSSFDKAANATRLVGNGSGCLCAS